MKGRKTRNTGGMNLAAADLADKPTARNYAPNITKAAEERKRGGRLKVMGEDAKAHAGRKPRKNGGRTGSDSSPFTSARHGTPPPGRKLDMEME